MESMEQEPLEPGSSVPAVREPDLTRLAEELVSAASDRGIALTGEDGLLTALTRQVLETGAPGRDGRSSRLRQACPPEGRDRGNSRNGTPLENVLTRRAVRCISRCPAIGTGLSSRRSCPRGPPPRPASTNVISLAAKGMTTGDIQPTCRGLRRRGVAGHDLADHRRGADESPLAVPAAGPVYPVVSSTRS